SCRRGFDAEEHCPTTGRLHLGQQAVEIKIRSMVRHPLYWQMRVHHCVAKVVNEPLIYGEKIVNQHEPIITKLLMEKAHLLNQMWNWFDAVLAFPKRSGCAERACERAAAASLDVDRSRVGLGRNRIGIPTHVDDFSQVSPNWR